MARTGRSDDDNTHLLSTGRRSKDDAEPSPEDIEADSPYFRFGKQVHRKYLGFGTMGSAFFARNLIADTVAQAANEDQSTGSLSRLKKAVTKHKAENSVQYRLMSAAALATMREFPDIREDCDRIDNGINGASKDLTSKLKQITRGMKAARQADTCTLKGTIISLAREHARRLGHRLDFGLRKDQRGIKNDGTACLFLPRKYMGTYNANPERFRAYVDKGDIMIGADEWPMFLYDEDMYNPKKEWVGLFLGETFVRACICILIGPSAAQEWPYGASSARTYAASNKKGNANLNDIVEITPEVVAGLVCQVTFALSDAGSWKDKIGDIDLIELYTNTVRILSMDFKWVDQTLDTLQSWILGEQEDDEPEDRAQLSKERFERLEKMMAESEDLSQGELTPPPQKCINGCLSVSEEEPAPEEPAPEEPGPCSGEEPGPHSDEDQSQLGTPPQRLKPKFSKGPRVAKPAANKRTLQASHPPEDSATFRTSPPSIPPSAPHETQDVTPSPRVSQRSKATPIRKKPTPAPQESQDPATTPHPPPTPHQVAAPRTSGTPQGSSLRKSQDSTSSTRRVSQTPGINSTSRKPKAGGSRMPPPKVPAKRQAPLQEADDNQTFGDSSLTKSPEPQLPSRKRQKAKTIASNEPVRRSRRTMSRTPAPADD